MFITACFCHDDCVDRSSSDSGRDRGGSPVTDTSSSGGCTVEGRESVRSSEKRDSVELCGPSVPKCAWPW